MESLHQSELENITNLYHGSLDSHVDEESKVGEDQASDFASEGSRIEVFLEDGPYEERVTEHFQHQDSSDYSEDERRKKVKIEIFTDENEMEHPNDKLEILDSQNFVSTEDTDQFMKEMNHESSLPPPPPKIEEKKKKIPRVQKWTPCNKEGDYQGIPLAPFLAKRGPAEDFSEYHPYDIFSLYITEDLKDYMVDQTNLYVRQLKMKKKAYIRSHKYCRLACFKDINKDELETFLGLYLLTSIHTMREYKDYYSQSKLLKTNYSKFMNRERFLHILSFIHLSDNTNPRAQTDKLYKVRYFYEYVQRQWAFYYQPGKEINIDEGMVPFTGRLGFLQYIKRKPHKWGIKVFLLCDSASAYCLKSTIYTGNDSLIENQTEELVKDLVYAYKHKGHVLYVDNFYTTISLMREMKEMGIGCTGTFQSKRIGNKVVSKGFDIKKGETQFYSNNQSEDVMLCLYRDRMLVKVLTNCGSMQILTKHIEDKSKTRIKHVPKVLDEYNMKARGVDRSNQLSLEFSHPHKSTKWWKVLFDYILQVCMANAFIIYQHYHPKQNHKAFILAIIEGLLREPQKKKCKILHLPEYIDPDMKSMKRLKCKNCPKLSQYYCKECSTMSWRCSLCMPECWRDYHQTLRDL